VRQDDRHLVLEAGYVVLQPPVETQHKVLVRLLRPQVLVALGLALGVVVDDAAGQDAPVTVVAFGHLPAAEILAVEERNEAALGCRNLSRRHEIDGYALAWPDVDAPRVFPRFAVGARPACLELIGVDEARLERRRRERAQRAARLRRRAV